MLASSKTQKSFYEHINGLIWSNKLESWAIKNTIWKKKDDINFLNFDSKTCEKFYLIAFLKQN